MTHMNCLFYCVYVVNNTDHFKMLNQSCISGGKKSHLVKLSYFLKILLGLNCQYFVRKKDVDVHVTFVLF